MSERKSNKHLLNERGKIVCEFCGKEFKPLGYAPHKSKHLGIKYSSQINPWNKGLTKETDDRIQKYVDTQKKNGSSKKRYQSLKSWIENNPEDYHNSSSRGGGYREKSGRSKGSYTEDSYGNKVWLQSSYELICSSILDSLKIRWLRPKPIRYTLSDKSRLYYPDFYLPDYNIYLDPKNDHRIDMDKEKIEVLKKVIRLEIVSFNSLNKEYILKLLTCNSMAE